MILFLALLGRAGHGKSTAARHFTEHYGARTISLATPLKNCAKTALGFSDAQLWGTQEEKDAIDPRYGFSCRRFLQLLGTDGMRKEFGDTIHLDSLVRRAAENYATIAEAARAQRRPAGDQIYIVDDARFRNEIAYLNSLPERFNGLMSGATIKIICTDAPPPEGELAQHPSEMEIDLVPQHDLAATVVSSRALGVGHLVGEIERAIETSAYLESYRSLRKAA